MSKTTEAKTGWETDPSWAMTKREWLLWSRLSDELGDGTEFKLEPPETGGGFRLRTRGTVWQYQLRSLLQVCQQEHFGIFLEGTEFVIYPNII